MTTISPRHDAMVAPMVVEGPITGEMFLAYIEQCLVPTLKRRPTTNVMVCQWLCGTRHNLTPLSRAALAHRSRDLAGTFDDHRTQRPIHQRSERDRPLPNGQINWQHREREPVRTGAAALPAISRPRWSGSAEPNQTDRRKKTGRDTASRRQLGPSPPPIGALTADRS
jgi:hypothetical protein